MSHCIIGDSKENWIKINLNKCKSNANVFIYLGHKISAREIEQDDTKIKAIMEKPETTGKKGIQRLIGLISHLAKFLPKLPKLAKLPKFLPKLQVH